MLTLLAVLWWVVLFPLLCTFAVVVYWRRKLQLTKGLPPLGSIAGFVFGGWYGYLVAFCLLSGDSLLYLFSYPQTAIGIQRQIGAEFISSLVGLATALCGRYLAKRVAHSRGNGQSNSEPAQDAASHDNLNAI